MPLRTLQADAERIAAATAAGPSHHHEQGASHHHHKPHHHPGHHSDGPRHGGHGASSVAVSRSHPVADDDEAPEKRLALLHKALQAVRSGRINASNASSASVAQIEGMGFADVAGTKTVPGSCGVERALDTGAYPNITHSPSSLVTGATQETRTFEEHFGFARPLAPAGPETVGGDASLPTTASAPTQPPAPFVDVDGRLHRQSGTLCVHRASAVTIEDKSLDLKVYFSKDFPITVCLIAH